ncbi:MAG: tellurite resistance TerB C-terminal domain-containing protein, partial [Thermomicrobiales bacterium]
DGSISPAEVTALRTIWKLLGRDPDRVASDLHAVMTGGRLDPTPTEPKQGDRSARRPKPAPPRRSSAADDPVVVRRATPETPGVRIPRPPGTVEPPSLPEPDLPLDPTAIARKIADSAAVSALLGDLLAEEAAPPAPVPDRSGADDPASPVAALLAALAVQETWAPEAFAALADGHGMLPNAALDLLNDLGFEHAGDPLLMEEADGSFRVDPGVLAAVQVTGAAGSVEPSSREW